MKTYVTINGKTENKISVFDHGFLYGDGVYDSFRIINKIPYFLDDHLNRLFLSAKNSNLKIPYSKIKLAKIINRTFKQSALRDAFIRIIVTRGTGAQGILSKCKPNVVIICAQRNFKPLQKIKLAVCKDKIENVNKGKPIIKTLNYAPSARAKHEAKKRGFDDCLLVAKNGQVMEATTSNIFLVKNDKIFTPSLASGCLPGIVRKAVVANFPVTEKKLSLLDFYRADEVFLTGSADFITSILLMEKRKYKKFDFAREALKKILNTKN
jgi:branched-chain amino acid aminotransferase